MYKIDINYIENQESIFILMFICKLIEESQLTINIFRYSPVFKKSQRFFKKKKK